MLLDPLLIGMSGACPFVYLFGCEKDVFGRESALY